MSGRPENMSRTIDSQTRWVDSKGREWRVIEKFPAGRNLCTTTDGRYQGEWTHKEIRAALATGASA